MFDQPFEEAFAEWARDIAEWRAGTHKWQKPDDARTAERATDYFGCSPDPESYRPEFPPGTATHYQMYETVTEGTPISPVMPDEESLARWLADNGASTFGAMTTDYDGWLAMIQAGSSVASALFVPGEGIISGVDAVTL
jgi:hypothetical protein